MPQIPSRLPREYESPSPDHRTWYTVVVNTVLRYSNALHLHQRVCHKVGDTMVRTSRFTLFLLRAGSGPSLLWERGGSPFLLGVGELVFGPSFSRFGFAVSRWELALPSCWPFLDLALGVKVVPAFPDWVNPRLSGWCLVILSRGGGVGPSFSGLGLACHSSGGGWSCQFGVGFGPYFELALLEMVGWPFFLGVLGLAFARLSLVVVGPSFLLSVFSIPSWTGCRALRDESWPCLLAQPSWGGEVRPSFLGWGFVKAPESFRKALKRKPRKVLKKQRNSITGRALFFLLLFKKTFSFSLSCFLPFLSKH